MFRRRSKLPSDGGEAGEADEAVEPAAEESAELTDEQAESAGPAQVAAVQVNVEGGPFDADSAPEDEIPRIDLGSLRVPMVDGLELRLDVDQQTGEPTQLLLADGESMLQLAAFAAPRSTGIWDEVRTEIAESLVGAGGRAEEVESDLGTELSAYIPTEQPGTLAPARFVGVDRPRWFLRGLLSGPAALDRGAAVRLEFVFRATVVVRGTDAMPIRDPLPLKLPAEAVQAAEEAQAAQAGEGGPTLEQLEQGPTITETR